MSKTKKKKSTVRHTRAIHRDRSKRPTVAPPDQKIEEHLTELIHPATFAQLAAFHAMGLRARTLSLPVMVTFVLSLVWRQIGAVSEAVRVLGEEGLLWTAPLQVTQQAVSERLRTLPSVLFFGIWEQVLPQLHARQGQRTRPLTPVLAQALEHFNAVLALDGSTLDVLLRKVGLLRDQQKTPLAGRMATLLDVASLLPQKVWFEADSQAHDQRFWQQALSVLEKGVLLIFDLGFVNYGLFDHLTGQGVYFITRLKKNAAYQLEQVFERGPKVCDHLIRLGSSQSQCVHLMRLIEVRYQGTWYRYLTNVLDGQVLPAKDVAALYRQRWRIEDAFNLVKRLLGLAYFFGGSQNAVELQLWATWLLYGVLIDLTDAVAETLGMRSASLSVEMVYRGLYHFTQAYHRGEADDPVSYLAEHAKALGLIKQKRRRKKKEKEGLTISSPP